MSFANVLRFTFAVVLFLNVFQSYGMFIVSIHSPFTDNLFCIA